MPRVSTNVAPTQSFDWLMMFGHLSNLFKLRIGVVMALTSVVALVATPGQAVPGRYWYWRSPYCSRPAARGGSTSITKLISMHVCVVPLTGPL